MIYFSLLETSCEQDDNFPSSVCVKVNGRLQTLPNPIPTNKPGVEPKRPPKPIDITALCKLSSTVPNFVNVTWAVEVRLYILKLRNSINYGCFADYRSQNLRNIFPLFPCLERDRDVFTVQSMLTCLHKIVLHQSQIQHSLF